MSDKKVYLHCDNGTLGWDEVSDGGSDYTAGYGIDIDENNVISGNITDNSSNSFTATTSVTFMAYNSGGGGGAQYRNAVVLRLDGSVDGTRLYPYNYYEINLAPGGGQGSLNFQISDQLDIMQGNPIYALLKVGKTNQISVNFDSSKEPRLININNAVDNGQLNITDYKTFLITLQFGIAKIEPVEAVSTNK